MQNQAHIQLNKEIRHFYIICILNIVFAALAMAFGVSYMVTAVSGLTTGLGTAGLRILTGAVAMVFFGFGLRWLLSTIRIFEGVEAINNKLDAEGTAITDDRITCLIVQMLAHYRDNHKTIGTMIHVCTFGGICFFILGITSGLEALSVSSGSIAFPFSNLLVIPGTLLIFGIACASLLSSYYFSRFAKVWDQRLREIDESECTLKEKLGLDGQ